PDVDGHEEGFCVKIVEGVLSVWKHSTPSFFTSQGLGSSSTRRHNRTLPTSPFRGKSPLAGAARIWYRG
ncbi:hypothetical protein CSW30_10725, partial [Thermus scotoductus]